MDSKFLDKEYFFVLRDFSLLGREWTEAESREQLVANILSGEYDRPLEAMVVNPVEGTSRIISEDIAREVLNRIDPHASICLSAFEFLEDHLGVVTMAQFARQLAA